MKDSQFHDLRRELREVRALIEELLAPRPSREGDELLDLAEAAALLGIAPETLRKRKAGTRSIPRQSSRPILFTRADVETFIRARAAKKREAQDALRPRLVRRRGKRAS